MSLDSIITDLKYLMEVKTIKPHSEEDDIFLPADPEDIELRRQEGIRIKREEQKDHYQQVLQKANHNRMMPTMDLAIAFNMGATRGRASSAHVEGDIFYSYRTPIAVRKNNKIYVDQQKYSHTTSVQQRYLSNEGAETIDHDTFVQTILNMELEDTGRLSEDIFKPATPEEIDTRWNRYANKKVLSITKRGWIIRTGGHKFKVLDLDPEIGKFKLLDLQTNEETGWISVDLFNWRRSSLIGEDIFKPAGEEEIAKRKDKYYSSPEQIEGKLEDYDLSVATDVDEIDRIYFISTPHDPSVGIIGHRMSPRFRTEDELRYWWTNNKHRVLRLWLDDDMPSDEFNKRVRELIRESEEELFLPATGEEVEVRKSLGDKMRKKEQRHQWKLTREKSRAYWESLPYDHNAISKLRSYKWIMEIEGAEDITTEVQKFHRKTVFRIPIGKSYWDYHITCAGKILQLKNGWSHAFEVDFLGELKTIEDYDKALRELYARIHRRKEKLRQGLVTEADEDAMFKPIQVGELEKRRKNFWKQLGPIRTKIQKLIPKIKALQAEYSSEGADWLGHYSDYDTEGVVNKISFDIKMYGVSLPDEIQKIVDEGHSQAVDEEYWMMVNESLKQFVEGLQEDYLFIEDWFQEGRMGGWLVLEINPVNGTEDSNTIMYEFEEEEIPSGELPSESDLEENYKILSEYYLALKLRIKDLHEIGNAIEKGKKYLEEWLGTKEAWESFLEYEKEEAK